jgi:hypothetical protein
MFTCSSIGGGFEMRNFGTESNRLVVNHSMKYSTAF